MIFVTGDTHGSIDFSKLQKFADENSNLSKKDYVIIAGDFGGVWNSKTLDKTLGAYEALPFTVLFVDGNHENFDLLDTYPVEFWNGGKVHNIRPDIIHLMRGQIFELEGKTFFTFGGASSTDKCMRNDHESWWAQEKPNFDELGEAIENLKKHNNEVDFIITHTCDEKALYYPPLYVPPVMPTVYPENSMLSLFEDTVKYKHWYFGHYHKDAQLYAEKTVLYQKIIRIV